MKRQSGDWRSQVVRRDTRILVVAQVVELADYAVGLRAGAGMGLDGVEQAAIGRSGAAVMEEENALANAPERSGAELIGTGRALGDVVGKTRAHVVDQQVGKQRHLLIAQTWREVRRTGLERRSVAGGAADLGEDRLAGRNRLRGRIAGNSRSLRSRRSEEAHEVGKLDGVAGNLIAGESEIGFVLGSGIVEAGGRGIGAFVGEQLVGHAHFDVVGFAGEYFERFVLSLPAETSDRAVVAAVVGMAGNAELLFETGVGGHIGEDGGIGDIFDEAGAEDGSGDAEDEVAELIRLLEVGLGQDAARGVLATGDGEKVVNSAIRSAGEAAAGRDYKRKARFAYRAFETDEEGNRIGAAIISRNGELRIGADEGEKRGARAGTADGGLR